MVHFVGAGPGAPDLITLRGAERLRQADVVIYAGSLVNPALLELCGPGCALYNSAEMTLEQVLAVIEGAKEKKIVRLHTGDPCLYGAVQEQMDVLDRLGIPYDITPGVSSFCGAAAAKATWPEEKTVRCTVGTLARAGWEHQISKTALVLVGDFLSPKYERSRLYDPAFTTGYREGQP